MKSGTAKAIRSNQHTAFISIYKLFVGILRIKKRNVSILQIGFKFKTSFIKMKFDNALNIIFYWKYDRKINTLYYFKSVIVILLLWISFYVKSLKKIQNNHTILLTFILKLKY